MDSRKRHPKRPRVKESHNRRQKEEGQPSFNCTICWRTQYHPSKPKVLGSAARIVCKSCWKAVLDLCICWVCGEYIVRGDEVVSLGWCFWHRSCFGCLICGTKISVPDFHGDIDDGRPGGLSLQLTEPPLCKVCHIETSGESLEKIHALGVENVSRFDGGLCKERLTRLTEFSDEITEKGSSGSRQQTTVISQSSHDVQLKDSSRAERTGCSTCSHRSPSKDRTLQSKDHNELDPVLTGDGSLDDRPQQGLHSFTHDQLYMDREVNTYLSIDDPVGRPAFKPSQTKPLPEWMHLLPNNIHREREKESTVIASRKSQKVDDEELLNLDFGISSLREARQYQSESSSSQRQSGPTSLGDHDVHLQSESTTPPIDIPNAWPRVGVEPNITFEPNPEVGRLDEEGKHGTPRSLTVESDYVTPPEYPRPPKASKLKTPFPHITRPPLDHHETSSYFSHRASTAGVKLPLEEEKDISCDPTTSTREGTPPLTPDNTTSPGSASPDRDMACTLSPLRSSEYLDKYHPQSASTPHARYIAKTPEPVLKRVKRQRNLNIDEGGGDEKKKVKKKSNSKSMKSLKAKYEKIGLDPRVDLHQELKHLFCEK